MKIFTVIGARPQFIKASVVSREIAGNPDLSEFILHTGQHYDPEMSAVFFEQLCIPRPSVQLNINQGNHGTMTGRMLIEIERILEREKPDRVLVYGDTNSTLAGALAAVKLHVPVAHVEAGLRSHDMNMPEEVNRLLTDQISDLLFCPTERAVRNLDEEGFSRRKVKIVQSGDVMQDAAMVFEELAVPPADSLPGKEFILATLHRAENTDDPTRLASIIGALNKIHDTLIPVVVPLHPRTRKAIQLLGTELRCCVISPVGYLEMLWLLKSSKVVVTDSGGLQKEAYFFQKHCITMRDTTEWTELVESGVNETVGADESSIVYAVTRKIDEPFEADHRLYGGGKASKVIVSHLL